MVYSLVLYTEWLGRELKELQAKMEEKDVRWGGVVNGERTEVEKDCIDCVKKKSFIMAAHLCERPRLKNPDGSPERDPGRILVRFNPDDCTSLGKFSQLPRDTSNEYSIKKKVY